MDGFCLQKKVEFGLFANFQGNLKMKTINAGATSDGLVSHPAGLTKR